jgi:hypothetical protein
MALAPIASALEFTGSHKLADILHLLLEGAAQREAAAAPLTGLSGKQGAQTGSVMARLDLISHGVEETAPHGGTPDALFELGLNYCVGRDVEIDLIEAHKWFNLAALRGNEEAKRHRLEISKEMSRDDISRAQKLAREWMATH